MPLHRLAAAGQSVWLDFIDRRMLKDGSLATMIGQGLRGMTSNPTIFEKALAESTAYDEQVAAEAGGLSAWELFERIETDDVRSACDLFMGVYKGTEGRDGYVSIEVSPGVANDSEGTIAEARRLWAVVDRPNVMVKVPGTEAGCRAVEVLIGEGINVNVTLLFSTRAYARVIEAYLRGLEHRASAGESLANVASVASFFVSRVDSEIDKRLAARAAEFHALQGQAAIANAKLAYKLFAESTGTERWRSLANHGAQAQRPLWASTSTKNPAYRDVIYVEALIGPHTVNTMPPATLTAFCDHGVVAQTVERDWEGAQAHLEQLRTQGIDIDQVTEQLLSEGLASFQKSFDTLIAGLERKSAALVGGGAGAR